jgi:hypothetical protein
MIGTLCMAVAFVARLENSPIAIQETLSGKNVDWLEKVSDEQYRK